MQKVEEKKEKEGISRREQEERRGEKKKGRVRRDGSRER